MPPNHPPDELDRRGLLITAGAFVLWGVVPLFWRLLLAVPSLQIIAHRVVWSAVLVLAWLHWQQGGAWLRRALARPRLWWMLALSALLIGCNWGLYIWAVNSGHVIETSLGYFINPLVNVLFGVLLLKERLNRVQWCSVALAAIAVSWLALQQGHPPWIAFGLAGLFALYGLIRKVAAVDAVPGMGIESLYLFLPAAALLVWGETHGQGGFLSGWGWRLDLLLIVGGAITALPLIGFSYGVRRVPLSVVGLLQYIAPTLQLLIGVFAFGEPFDRTRAIGFAGIWIALVLFAGDGWRRSRAQARRRAQALSAAPAP